MLRYVAIIRLEETGEARAAYCRAMEAAELPGFSHGFQTSAACLLYTDSAPGRILIHPLSDSGAVMGTLFRSVAGASTPTPSLSAEEAEDIIRSRGHSLISRHWGQYIAVIRCSNGIWRVVRDPTGGFPCYYARAHGMAIVFSHLSDCVRLMPFRLSINYSHLEAFLLLHRFAPRDTGFNEVQVVHAGEAVDFAHQAANRTFLWEPASFCRSSAEHDNVEASVHSVRQIVTKCVHSWAACRRSIMHELSGGLDSSIVLACLATAPSRPRITCCTHVAEAAEGDERYYARLMARHARIELIELPLLPQSCNRIEDLVCVRDPISPLSTAFQCSRDTEIRDVVEAGSFDCTFSGQGGDQLFQRTLPGLAAADYAWVHGLSPRLYNLIVETARASRQKIWQVARQALEFGYLRRPYDLWRGLQMPSFIRAPPIDVARSCHPWITGAAQLPPAKLLQVMYFTDLQTYFATPRPYIDEIHPLISQPLMECSLQIPAYTLSRDGTDRTIARAAFRDALPMAIAERPSKGAVSQFFFRAVYGNRPHIRQLLMDGLLAERGLLDREELKTALEDPATIARGRFLTPIMTATVCEMWLRTASSLAQSAGPSAAAHHQTGFASPAPLI